jgi:hypothetical protein
VLESAGVILRLVIDVLAGLVRPAIDVLAAVARSFSDLAPAALPGATSALVLAAAVVTAMALLAVALTLFLSPATAVAGTPHPQRAIADPTRLTASHPDAPGHSRPRAPGLAALAA